MTQISQKTGAAAAPVQSPFASDPDALARVAQMRRLCPKADPLLRLPDVHPCAIPRHIAIIMDGNGRWAREQGFPRIFGHRGGALSVRKVVEESGRLGVEALTLYSFSAENWKRPADEVQALMDLCVAYCEGELEALVREKIRFRVIGRREGLPDAVLAALDAVENATKDIVGPTLCLAINYSGRAEIADAARKIAEKVASGELSPDQIDEATLGGCLYAPDLPEPDLMIRTAGEMRLSNFLLWQLSYAELYVTDVYWPEFGEAELHKAVRSFASRSRRFGGLDPQTP